jgi:hypothetical protein
VNLAETLLVFAGIPLAIIAVLALLIFVPAARNRRPRYKPGQPWDHAPVWYEPHPEHAPASGHGETLAIGSSVYGERHGEETSGHSSATPAIAAPPVSAGPLGGARGTW